MQSSATSLRWRRPGLAPLRRASQIPGAPPAASALGAYPLSRATIKLVSWFSRLAIIRRARSDGGRFGIRAICGHKPDRCLVQKGLPFWTSEAVFYLVRNACLFGDHRRSHFRTPRGAAGSTASAGSLGRIGREHQVPIIKGFYVPRCPCDQKSHVSRTYP